MTPAIISDSKLTRAPAIARPRVIYITHRVPYPPDKGDRIRNYHLLRQLAKRADVHLIALADEPVNETTHAELKRLTASVTIVPVPPRRRYIRAVQSLLSGKSLSEGAFLEPAAITALQRILTQVMPQSVLISASSLAPYLSVAEKSHPEVRRYADVVDVDSQKWFDFAAVKPIWKRWLFRFEGQRVRQCETELTRQTLARALVSRAEADVYDSFAGTGSALVATNGVDLDYFQPQAAAATATCAFVGAMDYLPNIDAAIWFAKEVWPAVRAARPEAIFRIIGRRPTPAVQALTELPGIELMASVPDVRPFVASATLAVVPMRLSRGLQNKVLEAMAMAKPTIVAPPALAALPAVVGRDLLQASSPAEWTQSILDLLDDPIRQAELGTAARGYVETHHHWDQCLAPFINAIVAES
ncbi:MAG: TIGR03087 family PEP-CTERM/XrtA system glycosyltransferase [Gemmataceae bacterium]